MESPFHAIGGNGIFILWQKQSLFAFLSENKNTIERSERTLHFQDGTTRIMK